MESGAIVHLGSVTAYGDTYRGRGLHLVDMTGMLTAPQVRRERIDRPGRDGQIALPALLKAREATFSGYGVAGNFGALRVMSTRVESLITQEIVVRVQYPLTTVYGRGVVTAASFTDHGFAPEGTWGVDVEFDDPRLYGEEHTYTAGEEAFHWGTRPSSPVLLVHGPRPAYTITTSLGHSLTIGQSLALGQTHRIETRTGRLYLNGALQIGAITNGGMWTIPPGQVGVKHYISTGDLIVKVTDVY